MVQHTKSDFEIHKKLKEEKENEIQKREIIYKKSFLQNKDKYEHSVKNVTRQGHSSTHYIEKEYHVMGVHTKDIRRMGPTVYNENLEKRKEATLRCLALQRAVKDLNRHGPFSTRIIYDGKINYCDDVDNSVVDCKAYFDWSLKNNVKFMKDKIVGKVL
jgi:hypothetical protein